MILTLGLALGLPAPLLGQDILGTWQGALDVQGTQLRIVFHLTETDGQLAATMDSPDQGATGIPTDAATFEGGTLTIEAQALGLTYSAELSDDGTRLAGTFEQGPSTFPLDLTRQVGAVEGPQRPQEPRDFPYQQEDVRFTNPQGGHQLAGTLTKPQGDAFEKVAVLVSGSGPQNRDEELMGHKPFLVLSDHLTRQGIAVLRYDDRGVGESEGHFPAATTRDLADDAAAAVAYLRSRPDMADKAIGIVGHSEGGMIAPMLASEDPELAYLVLLAGPGIPIPELMRLQSAAISRAYGTSEEVVQVNGKTLGQCYRFIRDHPELDKDALKVELMSIMRQGFAALPAEAIEGIGDMEAFLAKETGTILSDWFLYFLRFDPATYLRQVNCPVLAINGELDLQVLAEENLAGIEAALAHNSKLTTRAFPGLNHLFQAAETGAPSEYARIEETFNAEAMQFVSDWIATCHRK